MSRPAWVVRLGLVTALIVSPARAEDPPAPRAVVLTRARFQRDWMPRRLSWSADGARLLACGSGELDTQVCWSERGVDVWRRTPADPDDLVETADLRPLPGDRGALALRGRVLRLAPDGSVAARSDRDGAIRMAVAPDGESVAVVESYQAPGGTAIDAIALRRTSDLTEVRRWVVSDASFPMSLEFDADGAALVWIASDDVVRSVRVTDASPPTSTATLERGAAMQWRIEGALGQGRFLAAGLPGQPSGLCVVSTSGESRGLRVVVPTAEAVTAAACGAHGAPVVAGTRDGRVLVVDLEPVRTRAVARTDGGIGAIALDPSGRRIAVATAATLRIFGIEGSEMRAEPGVTQYVDAAASSEDGRALAVADRAAGVLFWRDGQDSPPRVLAGLGAPLALSADGARLAGTRDGREIVVVETATPDRIVRVLVPEGHEPSAIAGSGDGARVVVGSRKRVQNTRTPAPDASPTIEAWDVASGKRAFALSTDDTFGSSVEALTVARDGRTCLAGMLDRLVEIALTDGSVVSAVREPEFPLLPGDDTRQLGWVTALRREAGTDRVAVVHSNHALHVRDGTGLHRVPHGLGQLANVAWVPGANLLVATGCIESKPDRWTPRVEVIDPATSRATRSWNLSPVDLPKVVWPMVCPLAPKDGRSRVFVCSPRGDGVIWDVP